MALTIIKAVDQIETTTLTTAIYGSPGVGKSTLAFTANNPILFDFDRGAHRAKGRKDIVRIERWQEIATITDADLEGYDTVVLDTVGRCLDMISAWLITDNSKNARAGGALSQQGWGALKYNFGTWLARIRGMGKDVVLIAHSQEDHDGDLVKERLDVQGGSKTEIYKLADLMGRIFISADGKRTLDFSPTSTAFGKNPGQLPVLPIPDVDLEPDFLANVLQQTKDALNQLSDAQLEEQKRIDALRETLLAIEDADGMNAWVSENAGASRKDKAIALTVFAEKGFKYDKAAGSFVEEAK